MNQKQLRRRHLKRVIPVMLLISTVLYGLWSFVLSWLTLDWVSEDSYLFINIHKTLFILMILGMVFYGVGSFAGKAQLIRKITFIFMGYFHVVTFFTLIIKSVFLIIELIFQKTISFQFHITFSIVATLFLLALFKGSRFPKIVYHNLKLPKWKSGSNRPFKLVHLSDVHVGMLHLDKTFVENLVEKILNEKPDAIVITGDLVEAQYESIHEWLNPFKLLSEKAACYFVTGNHEYYYGGKIWEEKMSSLGWIVLHNSNSVLNQQINFAGVIDHKAHTVDPTVISDPVKAMQGIDQNLPTIFLAHEPISVYQLPHSVELMLCGHTHGGQIFPFNLFVLLQQPMIKGFKTINQTLVFTHQGTGFWGPPLRLLTQSEIVIFSIT